jgi:hypothetical protein
MTTTITTTTTTTTTPATMVTAAAIPNNKLDIIIYDKEGTCMLIDVAIPGDKVIKEEAEKILKYNDLIIHIQCMWNVKAKVTLVIRWVSETISKTMR